MGGVLHPVESDRLVAGAADQAAAFVRSISLAVLDHLCRAGDWELSSERAYHQLVASMSPSSSIDFV